MRQTRSPFPVVPSPPSFSKDAVITPRAPACQPILPPTPLSDDRLPLADLGYTPAQVEQLLAVVKDSPGMTVIEGGAFALPIRWNLAASLPDWLSQVNAHDVRPPYQTGVNPDLDLFLEANMVDFPEGTPLCELHHRLRETFTAADEADLIDEGLELAFKPRAPELFQINLDEFHLYGGNGPSPELQEQVDRLNERLRQSFEQESAAFTQALMAEAQALPTTDPRHPGVATALRQVAAAR